MGHWPALQVDLVSDKWHVTLRNRLRNVILFTFPTDDALLSAKDELLEPLVANALSALNGGKELPTDDRGRGKTTFNNATAPARRAVMRTALRPPMLAVYAIAFAAGFVIGPPLLMRPSGQPPVARWHGQGSAQGRASEHVQRVVTPLGTSGQVPDTRRRAAVSARPSPSSSQPTVVSPPTPVRQTAIVRPPSAVAPPEPTTSVPGTDQPTSFVVVTPAPDTPATAGAAQGAAQETPRFHVQVGAFASQEEAQGLVQRLQSLGYVATSSNEGDVYRVWVGGYFDRETAARLAASMRKAGFNAVLVP